MVCYNLGDDDVGNNITSEPHYKGHDICMACK